MISLPLFGAKLKSKYVLHSLSIAEERSTSEQDDDTQDRKNDHVGETANCTAFHENMN
jgi:hypothetical protein